MNKVFLLGNICKDIEVRYTQGNEPMAVARFSVAVQRKSKNSQGQYDSDFISCIAFKNTAENIGKYFGKGSKIAVEGRIQTGSYQKQDGTKVYTTDVVVDGFDFCEKSSQTANQPSYGGQPTSYAPQPQTPSYAPQGQNQQVQQYAQPQAPLQQPQPQYTTYAPQQAAEAIADVQVNAPQAQQAINEGFMQIPEGADAAGLPWN